VSNSCSGEPAGGGGRRSPFAGGSAARSSASAGDLARIEVVTKPPRLLRLAEAPRVAIHPAGKDRLDAPAERFVLVRQLLTQVADQAALPAAAGLKRPPRRRDDRPKPLQRRAARAAQAAIQHPSVVPRVLIDDLQAEVVLAGKVMVERSLRHAGRREHLLNSCVVIAFRRDEPRTRAQQRLLRPFLRHT